MEGPTELSYVLQTEFSWHAAPENTGALNHSQPSLLCLLILRGCDGKKNALAASHVT